MQAYKLIDGDGERKPEYHLTRDSAHKGAKEMTDYTLREDIRIELVEFDTDKQALCHILSGWGCTEKILRTWTLTRRLGLAEVANGE